MNDVRVFTLMAGLTARSVAAGRYSGGQGGMMMATSRTDPPSRSRRHA